MSLALETLVTAACMSLLSALPLLSQRVRARSRELFLMGTGAMVGICVFDLVPDVMELGGPSTAWVMGGVWLVYSTIHFFHLFHHEHGEDLTEAPGGFFWFFIPLVAHSFASGMLLAVSQGFSKTLEGNVFLALLTHKAYESLLLSSIVMGQRRGARWNAVIILSYASALPLGAMVTSAFGTDIGRSAAILISSLAVGTLLGCLVFDFLLPSLRHLKARKSSLAWIAAGLLLTQWIMTSL